MATGRGTYTLAFTPRSLLQHGNRFRSAVLSALFALLLIAGAARESLPQMACDPSLACGSAITCVDGLAYPTTCGPRNCDLSIGPCTGVAAGSDSFSSASGIRGASGQATGSNAGASKEPGEPDHAGRSGGASLWWRWTAPASGAVAIDTAGSDFDTLLAVYTGGAVDALTEVASNDDAVGLQSEVRFTAQQGVVYHVAVDGYDGATGSIVLNWRQAGDAGMACDPSLACGAAITCVDGLLYPTTCGPRNCDLPIGPCAGVGAGSDSFSLASSISSASGQATGSNAGASKEPGEPDHAGRSGGASLWWRWTAPASGAVAIDTAGSDFDTLLAVYTGGAVDALTEVASNDDAVGLQSEVRFTAQQGVVYHVAVDGYGGETGSIVLNWRDTGAVSLSAAAAEIDEGADRTPVALTVTLSEPVTGDVAVALASTGTARLGSDFDLGSTLVTVIEGGTQGTTTVTPIRDLSAEGDETIVLEIDALAGRAEIGSAPSTVQIDIRDLGELPQAEYAKLDAFMWFYGEEPYHIDADALYLSYIVRNRGRVAASPTRAALYTATDYFSENPQFRRLTDWRPVPALEPSERSFDRELYRIVPNGNSA